MPQLRELVCFWQTRSGRKCSGERCLVFKAKQTWPVLHGVRKGRNPETGVYPECAAYSCKSLQPQISSKSAEIPPTFQRAFLNWECASSNPPRSARHSGVRPGRPRNAGLGRKWRLFALSISSPDSQFGNLGAPIAENLQPRPRIFPFCGDFRQRLGAITTAARQSIWATDKVSK
jgi:hypothetical protein